ncbi:MAG: hypothetical protein ACMG6E_08255 [Candidatus Roizmanbacteria bacterium]
MSVDCVDSGDGVDRKTAVGHPPLDGGSRILSFYKEYFGLDPESSSG